MVMINITALIQMMMVIIITGRIRLYCTILYCTVLYYTILYYALLNYTILYHTILYQKPVNKIQVSQDVSLFGQ